MLRNRWVRRSVFVVFLLSVASVAPMIQALLTLPAINDITTDLVEPPEYFTLEAPPYPANLADRQRAGYPDLGPLVLDAAPDEAFARAQAAALEMNWDIRDEDADAGRIEAVATTPVLRYRDDVVVRLRPDGDGTRVDLRSRSRIGIHDLGTNARRIRAFLERLKR